MELFLHVLDVQAVDEAPPPEIKRYHRRHQESIVRHHGDGPEDRHGREEYRVPQVQEEVLLFL